MLVAPQFAINAADSSAGKFWEPNGFKRFLDEAALEPAGMNGDPRSAFRFARMPIVIVAYGGGIGPTLSVLGPWPRRVARARPGSPRCTVRRLLRKRSVPYSSVLRNSHLQSPGLTFLPAGAISHRDFVTHA